MIVRKGTRICERCAKEYEWAAYKLEPGEGFVGAWDSTRWINVLSFEAVNGRLIATGRCPFCHATQIEPLVDEKMI